MVSSHSPSPPPVQVLGSTILIDWKAHSWKPFAEAVLTVGIAGELICLAVSLVDSAELNERANRLGSTNILMATQLEQLRSNNLVLSSDVLKLEAEVQPRRITAEQKKIILEGIVGKISGKVTIQCLAGEAESQVYAQQFRDVFKEAGLEVQLLRSVMVSTEDVRTGIEFNIRDRSKGPPIAVSLLKLLRNAGIRIPADHTRTDGSANPANS